MLIIGIDPGISGAICFFLNGEVIDIIDMPSMADGKKNKNSDEDFETAVSTDVIGYETLDP